MGMILVRSLGKPESLLHGEWCAVIVPHPDGHSIEVNIRCPECGNIDEIPVGDVERGGKVRAEWKCPKTACPFEEWIILESFGEPVFGRDVKP